MEEGNGENKDKKKREESKAQAQEEKEERRQRIFSTGTKLKPIAPAKSTNQEAKEKENQTTLTMGNCLRSKQTFEIPINTGSIKPSTTPRRPRSASKPTNSSTRSFKTATILDKPMVDINSLFTFERELGRGQFGITWRVTERTTGVKYACKSVSKRKLQRKSDIDDIRREVMMLQHLTGQPNIVEFKGAYEDGECVHLVMELCSGGDLSDRITSKGSYTEQKAAAVFRNIVNVVNVCHFMGVMHRDLKPENFLFVSKEEDSEIKVTDFRLSVFIETG